MDRVPLNVPLPLTVEDVEGQGSTGKGSKETSLYEGRWQ